MFKKVITTDCLDSINIAIIKTLQELNIPNIQHSNYCDETFLKIKKAQIDNEPFDLLISDLSFRKDHRNEKLQSGMELIRAVKKIQPNLKILVFSIENKTYRIKKLIENEGINGYVLNGRNSIPELKKAIQSVYSNDAVFLSPTITNKITDNALLEIENYDIELLMYLSKGFTQDKIGDQFKKNKITPYGSSSIEKRINKLKVFFRANNNTHLIALTKDLGII
jgi:two-component system, NarL family, captular synthesis response regulator RcsB